MCWFMVAAEIMLLKISSFFFACAACAEFGSFMQEMDVCRGRLGARRATKSGFVLCCI